MGKLVSGSMMIEGYFARMMYLSLYKVHERALHGTSKVALSSLARPRAPQRTTREAALRRQEESIAELDPFAPFGREVEERPFPQSERFP
jgi:hypothetical protein